MDLQKEREAFEEYIISKHKNRSPLILTQRIQHGFSENYIVQGVQDCWETWQAAKAQEVPDLGELQERIAGHQYCHDEHGHMIVDMDDVVKEISGFDSWKAQAVPEGFVLVKKELPEQIAEKMAIDRIDKPRHENDPVWSEIAEQSYKDQVKSKKWEFWRDYKAMIEAQEPAND